MKRRSEGGGVQQVEACDGGGRGAAALGSHRSPPRSTPDTGASLASLSSAAVCTTYTVTLVQDIAGNYAVLTP